MLEKINPDADVIFIILEPDKANVMGETCFVWSLLDIFYAFKHEAE